MTEPSTENSTQPAPESTSPLTPSLEEQEAHDAQVPDDDGVTTPEAPEVTVTDTVQGPETVQTGPEPTLEPEPTPDPDAAVFAAHAVPVEVPEVPDDNPASPANAADEGATFQAFTTGPVAPSVDVDAPIDLTAGAAAVAAAVEPIDPPKDITDLESDRAVLDEIRRLVADLHQMVTNTAVRFPELLAELEGSTAFRLISKFIK